MSQQDRDPVNAREIEWLNAQIVEIKQSMRDLKEEVQQFMMDHVLHCPGRAQFDQFMRDHLKVHEGIESSIKTIADRMSSGTTKALSLAIQILTLVSLLGAVIFGMMKLPDIIVAIAKAKGVIP